MSQGKYWSAGEVAKWFKVTPEVMKYWEKTKRLKLPILKTPGGHRRFSAENVREIANLRGVPVPQQVLE